MEFRGEFFSGFDHTQFVARLDGVLQAYAYSFLKQSIMPVR